MMSYVHANLINVFKSEDGKSELEILHRKVGFFEYTGLVGKHDNDGRFAGEPYCVAAEHSGICDTAEDAERAAQNEEPWLQALNEGKQ